MRDVSHTSTGNTFLETQRIYQYAGDRACFGVELPVNARGDSILVTSQRMSLLRTVGPLNVHFHVEARFANNTEIKFPCSLRKKEDERQRCQ